VGVTFNASTAPARYLLTLVIKNVKKIV
jgi:hypothetical protein